MREHFTILLKENDTSNLKLLTEKLNEGFYIENRIEVGRSTCIVLHRAQNIGLDAMTDSPVTRVPRNPRVSSSGAVTSG